MSPGQSSPGWTTAGHTARMGRIKKNRGRRDDALPQGLHWTPLQQVCGCVVEWGWDSRRLSPPTFIEWCLAMREANCPWHGAETGMEAPPEKAVVRFKLTGPQVLYCKQAASVERQELGKELTRQSSELTGKLREDADSGILMDIPAKLQRVWRAKGVDPVAAWMDMRLTDIFLNHGRVTLTDEMIEMLPEPSR